MSWMFLAVAILGDVAGTVALERSAHRRRGLYLGLAASCYLAAVLAFALALRAVPTAVADAIYFAGATAAVALVSVAWLGERLTPRKALALALIVAGVVVLRLETAHE